MGCQPLCFQVQLAMGPLGQVCPGRQPKRELRARGFWSPRTDNLSAVEYRTRSTENRPQLFVFAGIRDDQVSILALEEQIESAEQPQRLLILFQTAELAKQPAFSAVYLDFDRILRPMLLDLRHRRIQEGRDIVRRCRSEKPQIVADWLQRLRRSHRIWCRSGPTSGPVRDATQDRWRGARL